MSKLRMWFSIVDCTILKVVMWWISVRGVALSAWCVATGLLYRSALCNTDVVRVR